MRKLEDWERQFNSVGWFIPAYIQMGSLAKLAGEIRAANGTYSQDDLESALERFYDAEYLAAMVCARYPLVPIISEFRVTIEESILAHFLGLHHVAVAGLMPVIEGAGRRLAKIWGPELDPVKAVFSALTKTCREEAYNGGLGDSDEVASMLTAFEHYTRHYVYANSRLYTLPDGTNRNGIAHGAYSDTDFGRPLNFYKTISAIDFLAFISTFRAPISWLGPNSSNESMALAARYRRLKKVAAAG